MKPYPLGEILRAWRACRGRSQLALSLDMGVSQRHVSFIESGRSKPSRALLLEMAQSLDIPLRERNALLLTAGFAPVFAESAWNAAEMAAVRRALQRMLKLHEPYPAIVMDRHWNVLMRNASAPHFFNRFIDLNTVGQRNLLHLIFDPSALRPFIANWDEVSGSLFQRIRREAAGGILDEQAHALIAELEAYPNVRGASPEAATTTLPMIPIRFLLQGRMLSYFSMVSTVGTPLTVAAQELRVESMFPADDATETWHVKTFASL